MAQFKSSALAHGTTSPRRPAAKQGKCGRCCRSCLRTVAVVLCILAAMAAYRFQQRMTLKTTTATTTSSDLLVLGVKDNKGSGAGSSTSSETSVKKVELPSVMERVEVKLPVANHDHTVGEEAQDEGVTATDETHNIPEGEDNEDGEANNTPMEEAEAEKEDEEDKENNTPNEQEEDDNDRHQHGNDPTEGVKDVEQPRQQQDEDDNDRHQHANEDRRESEENRDPEAKGGIPKANHNFNADSTNIKLHGDENESKDKQQEDSVDDTQSQLQFDANHPVFVLSLPFSNDLVLPRYWQCAKGIDQPGRYWTKPNPTHKKGRKPIGQCMLENMMENHAMAEAAAQVQPSDYLDNDNNNAGGGDDDQTINNPHRPQVPRIAQQIVALPKKNITENCGKFKVWTDLQFLTPPLTKTKWKHPEACFDPVLYPNALAELHRNYPQATILTIQYTDPKRWYRQLPKDIKQFWRKYCNPTHNQAFPPKGSTTAAYVQFYQQYYQTIDTFIQTSAPGWKHITVQWWSGTEENHARNGQMLETALGIPAKCWVEAAQGTMIQPAFLDDPDQDVPTFVKRPNDFQFPILVASLPKSGTSSVHNYFKCGMGNWTTKHQWTTPTASTMEKPLPNIPIGKCFLDNLNAGTKNMVHGCGHARVWNDIGYMTPPKQPKSDNDDENNNDEEQEEEEEEEEESVCFYPTLHKGAMEAFSKAYPRGTIFHMVRNAADWAESARRWAGNLLHRWSSMGCQGFPSSEATMEDWEDFYRRHTRLVRNFAKRHPNMTYIELPLTESKTGDMLQNIFGFHPSCWGTFNQFGD